MKINTTKNMTELLRLYENNFHYHLIFIYNYNELINIKNIFLKNCVSIKNSRFN